MRKLVAGIFISIAVAMMSQDRSAGGGSSGSPSPDFAGLKPFVRGLAFGSREVAVYSVRAAVIPIHRHPKPFVIVWTENGSVTEQRDGGAPTNRTFSAGQIDFYPGGTKQSLKAGKGSLRFTLVELQQNQRQPKVMPREVRECANAVEFPQGGFACLIQIAADQQVTIPELDVNSVYIAVDSGKIRTTIPRGHSWETHFREGGNSYLPGYEKHDLRNVGPRQFRLVLIVPPTAE